MTTRTDLPSTWDERASILAMLDYTRATALMKCEGVTDKNAAKAPLPTSPLMTLGGIVSHLLYVERWWIESIFLGEDPDYPWTDEEPDAEYTEGAERPIADVLRDYAEQSEKYRQLIAGLDFDALAQRKIRDGRKVTLRWIVLHLTEETARHNGHLDIIRELVDGVTGD